MSYWYLRLWQARLRPPLLGSLAAVPLLATDVRNVRRLQGPQKEAVIL